MVAITSFKCDYCKKPIEPRQFVDNGHPTREPIMVSVDVDSPFSGIHYEFHFHREDAPQGYASIGVMMNEIYAGWERDELARMEAAAAAQVEMAKAKGGKIEVVPRSPALGPANPGKRGHRK